MQDHHSIELLKPLGAGDGFYRYTHWLANAWSRAGMVLHSDVNVPHPIRVLGGRYFSYVPYRRRTKLIVMGSHRIESVAWPWVYKYDIVPMIWDLWPRNLEAFIRFLKYSQVDLCFCTQSYNCRRIESVCPQVKAIWIPEGIDVDSYPAGGGLRNRPIDILNYGRQVNWLNEAIEAYHFRRDIIHVHERGRGLLYKDFESLTQGIRDSKLVICYPKCDTCPEVAGDVETLTQRYWECMCSGALVIGRAPKELIDFCGYNPVIEIDRANCCEQIQDVLDNIDDYQKLADKNRNFACKFATWDSRVKIMLEALKETGYAVDSTDHKM